MIAHLCRLEWNRRRTNLLLVGELLLAFLVLTPLITGWMLFAAEELKPLGFEYENVWSAMLMDIGLFGERRDMSREQAGKEYRSNIERVWQELQALDEVEAMALASQPPFMFSETWSGIASVEIGDDGLEVLGLQLLSGRWFRPEDEALDWTPAVIDQELGQALFGDEDPLGKVVGASSIVRKRDGNIPPDRVRVVGVVEHCFYYKNLWGERRTLACGDTWVHISALFQ